MTMRIRDIPGELRRNVTTSLEDVKSILFEKKEDSFFVSDQRLLRTIFDDPAPKSIPNSPSEPQNPETKETHEIKEILNVENPEDSPKDIRKRAHSGNSPQTESPKIKEKSFARGHRRSNSETGSPSGSPLTKAHSSPTRSQLFSSLPKSNMRLNRSEINLSHSGRESSDAIPSTQTLARSKAMKVYIEEYYWELLAYLQGRSKRERTLKKSLQTEGKNKFQQESLVREHLKQETTILRSRRLCGRLNDFHLIKRIGKGAYGEVFLVQKRNTKEYLALKKLSKANLHVKNQIAHITTEKDVLKDADSSWLVHLLYTFQDSEYVYFAMDYIPGGDLRTYIEKMGDLPEEQAKLFMAEMLLSVDALHLLGYIHRDLKPDNFLIDKDGHLKLADFGLSKKGVLENYKEPFKGQLPNVKLFAPGALSKKGSWKDRRVSVHRAKAYSLVGSPDYMAVEILRGAGYEWEADWWSLGCILFELLVGFPPFTGETPHEVFANVMNYEYVLENPQLESDELIIKTNAWDLITKLICEPSERLGRESALEIKSHIFFEGFDWDHVREMKPMFIPQLSSETDTSYFASAQDIKLEDDNQASTFLQKINNLPNLTFDDLTFSKAIFEREKIYNSSSDEESPRRKDNNSPRTSVEPNSGRKSPRPAVTKRAMSSRSLKKVSSFDKLGSAFWRVHARSNRGGASNKEQSVIGETVSLNYLSIHDWKVLCTGAQRIILPRNAVIMKEGDYNTALWRIKTGAVRIEKQAMKGNTEGTVILNRLEKNKVFGEMSFVEDEWKPGTKEEEGLGGNVSASVVVDSETCELYKIERSFIFSLFIADRDLFARFYQIIACMLADRVINLPLRDKLKNTGTLTPSPRNSPRGNQELTNPNSPRPSPNRVEKKHEDRARDLPRNTPSPTRDVKSEKTKKKRDAKFVKRFKLPPDEYLIKAYKCTMARVRGTKSKKFHGRLFIGSNHICFYSRIFGYIYKKTIPLRDIVKLKRLMLEGGEAKIKINAFGKKYLFYSFEKESEAVEAYKVIENIYDAKNERKTETDDPSKTEGDSSDDDNSIRTRTREGSIGSTSGAEMIPDLEDDTVHELSLSQEDWGLILEGSECITYMKDQIILREGDHFENIYQIGSGIVRVQRTREDGKVEVLGTMGTLEMFGEISFMGGVGASVSIVADQNNVDIYIIGKDYIESLFQKYKDTGIEGKFYKFIALVLSRRIRQRELEEQLKASTSKPVFLTNME